MPRQKPLTLVQGVNGRIYSCCIRIQKKMLPIDILPQNHTRRGDVTATGALPCDRCPPPAVGRVSLPCQRQLLSPQVHKAPALKVACLGHHLIRGLFGVRKRKVLVGGKASHVARPRFREETLNALPRGAAPAWLHTEFQVGQTQKTVKHTQAKGNVWQRHPGRGFPWVIPLRS